MGTFAGFAMMAWYPDPYRFDVKGTVVRKVMDLRYITSNLKAPVLWSALACGTFSGVECVFEQLRDESKDNTAINAAAGGAAAGIVIGAFTKRFDIMALTAFSLGGLMGLIEQNGSKVQQNKLDSNARVTGSVGNTESKTVEELKQKYPEYKDL